MTPVSTARESWRGWYLDGRTPARRAASVEVCEGGLRITTEDGAVRSWRVADFRQTQGFYPGESVRLERGREGVDVVIVDDGGFARALRAMTGGRRAGVRGPRRRASRALVAAGAFAIALVLTVAMYRWGVPAAAGAVTAMVPVRWEEQLGEQAFAAITASSRLCTDPRLETAIAGITARLAATIPHTPYRFRVAVLDVPGVNAIALPGGRIVVLRGLLAITESPEMLAGVLGHEFQHVVRRHATRAIVRQAALSGMISVVTQDARWVAGALGGAGMFGALQYGRAAEAEADREGLRMLQAAGIDPAGMIAFFGKLAADDEPGGERAGVWRLLASHPATRSRIDTLTALAARGGTKPVPLSLSTRWEETRALCVEP